MNPDHWCQMVGSTKKGYGNYTCGVGAYDTHYYPVPDGETCDGYWEKDKCVYDGTAGVPDCLNGYCKLTTFLCASVASAGPVAAESESEKANASYDFSLAVEFQPIIATDFSYACYKLKPTKTAVSMPSMKTLRLPSSDLDVLVVSQSG